MKEKYFKEGDLVTCVLFGKGQVKEIKDDLIFPVIVSFNTDKEERYTFDGRFLTRGKRTLHQGHIEIKEPVLVPIKDKMENIHNIVIVPLRGYENTFFKVHLRKEVTEEMVMSVCDCIGVINSMKESRYTIHVQFGRAFIFEEVSKAVEEALLPYFEE